MVVTYFKINITKQTVIYDLTFHPLLPYIQPQEVDREGGWRERSGSLCVKMLAVVFLEMGVVV